MLTVLAHTGRPPAPHDLWSAWNLDPVVLLGLALAVWTYQRGRRRGGGQRGDRRRARCFAGAMVAIAVALVSPLDALAGALASAHMVQHVLLVVVAGPLLALSAPSSAMLRGSPLALRRARGRWRRRLHLPASTFAVLRNPAVVWLLHVGTLWFWHSASAYGAALGSGPVHVLEHVTFLGTSVLLWRVVVGPRGIARDATAGASEAAGTGRVSRGLGALLVFATAMQSVFLSVLLTFAREPWYTGYGDSTAPWGLDPLADQQLAGVLLWVPGGAVYAITAVVMVAAWVRSSEPGTVT